MSALPPDAHPVMLDAIAAYASHRDALRPLVDRLAAAALAYGDAVASGDPPSEIPDDLHRAICAWRDEVRRKV